MVSRRVNQPLLVVGLLIVVNGVCSSAFVSAPSSRRVDCTATSSSSSSSSCWARKPRDVTKSVGWTAIPVPKFDLAALEAVEAQLLADELAAEYALVSDEDLLEDDDDDDEEDDTEAPATNVDIRTYTVTADLNNKRIDAAIASLMADADEASSSLGLSRSFCGNLVTDGSVYVDGQLMNKKSVKVVTGQELSVHLPVTEKVVTVTAQDIPLTILFEDEHMIVLNKAANMVVHPAAGNWDGTVVNALAYYLSTKSPFGGGEFTNDDDDTKDENFVSSFRPGIVHRLDKGTTGCLVVAKTSQALGALSSQFANRKVKKTYLAVTVGNPGKQVVIDKPIGRHPIHRQRMRVVPDPHKKDSSGMTPSDRIRRKNQINSPTVSGANAGGRRALSVVDTIFFDGKLSLAQVRIETGRTHQIRVHLQDRHTPIYGDDIYGLADWNKRLSKTHAVSRPLLHAFKLQLEHPVTGELMLFQAPLAEDMLRIAKAIYPQGGEEMPEVFGTAVTTDDESE